MEYKDIRINTNIGIDNQYLNFKLEQEFDNINVLSLKLTQSDVYNTFNSDYGCIVGRVIANGGVGVPNVKLSVFIPLTEEDEQNDDIRSIYPYKSPEDVDLRGYKYNLLPRVSQVSPFIGTFVNDQSVGYTPKTPVGTFPTKEEILTNDILLDIYKKYYKFTAVTNESGDYMIFGVPVGTHVLHMSSDITDIGKYSMTPATMVKLLGVSENLFENNGTSIRKTPDLDELPNVQLQNVSVDVRPFWGDTENFEIGITRQDFKIRSRLLPIFTVFGSITTMGQDGLWGISKSDVCSGNNRNTCLFHTINNYDDGDDDISGFNVENFRLPKANTEIYTIRNSITDQQILSNNFDIDKDIIKLTSTDYTEFIDNGVFVYLIPCNRKKIITNEFGDEIEVNNDNPDGIFTEFNGYFLMDTDDLTIQGNTSRDGLNRARGSFIKISSKFKVPQSHGINGDFLTKNDEISNVRWIKKNRKFKANEFYSISQFYSISYVQNGDKFSNSDLTKRKYNTVGIIQTSDEFIDIEPDPNDPDPPVEILRTTTFPSNTSQNLNNKYFGSQWLNMSIFQIQFAASDRKASNRVRASSFLLENNRDPSMFFMKNNTQNLGGGRFDSQGFITARYHYFDFINIKREDIIKMGDQPNKKIFRTIEDNLQNFNTDPWGSIEPSSYKYAPNNNTLKSFSDNDLNIIGRDLNPKGAYLYKGLNKADCIKFLNSLNLI